jgi:hypothetical protein
MKGTDLPWKKGPQLISEVFIVLSGFFFYFLAFLLTPIITDFLQLQRRTASQVCIPTVPSQVHSTSRDVIFLYGTSFHSGLELALRSLNATGCRARVVLFMAPSFSISLKSTNLLKSLNVEAIPNCGARPPQRRVVPHMVRFHYEYDWLVNHTGQIDRVLHSDAYDIFFQSDPFIDVIKFDYLSFVVEPHFIRGCGWNLSWFQQCFGSIVDDFKKNFIICSSSIGGNATFYQCLVGLMLNTSQWESCYHESKDQPILNYLVWSGQVKAAGIKYRFTGCDGGMMTLQWCVLNYEVKFNDKGQVLSPSNTVPAYLHQYPRLQSLKAYLYSTCGMSA